MPPLTPAEKQAAYRARKSARGLVPLSGWTVPHAQRRLERLNAVLTYPDFPQFAVLSALASGENLLVALCESRVDAQLLAKERLRAVIVDLDPPSSAPE